LEFVPPILSEDTLNRFSGRLFERIDHGGHMFVQHYLTNMFGVDKEVFLNQTMDAEEGNRMRLRPELAENHHLILHDGERNMTVREVSRLVHYLGGGDPLLTQ
jgi:hypothetical protein